MFVTATDNFWWL